MDEIYSALLFHCCFWIGEMIKVQFHSIQMSNIILNLLLIMNSPNRSKAPPPLGIKKKTPMQVHNWTTNNLHASTWRDKHWPSTLHWVSEWQQFIFDWHSTADCCHNWEKKKKKKHTKKLNQNCNQRCGSQAWRVESQKWECATADDKASHEAEDQVKLILESSVMILHPRQLFSL